MSVDGTQAAAQPRPCTHPKHTEHWGTARLQGVGVSEQHLGQQGSQVQSWGPAQDKERSFPHGSLDIFPSLPRCDHPKAVRGMRDQAPDQFCKGLIRAGYRRQCCHLSTGA